MVKVKIVITFMTYFIEQGNTIQSDYTENKGTKSHGIII